MKKPHLFAALPLALILAGPDLSLAARPDDDDLSSVEPAPPVAPEVVARGSDGRVTLRAVRIDTPLDVDGVLEESVYSTIPAISDFVQQEPQEGAAATEKTEVWVLFDQKNLYIAARCWDSHPEREIANEMRRDSMNIFQNENFAVALDTFYDRRNGFLFHTNPVGGMFDGYVTDERDVNRDWNTVWDARPGRFPNGWTVEIAIPFKSLRYKTSDSQVWGINFRRIVRWKNETSYLTPIPASYSMRGINKVSSAATMVGVEPPPGSRNLELKPYAKSGLLTNATAAPPVSNDLDAAAGFDAKYGVTRSLTFDFTYNTDFAQVEEDEQQVNLSRFSLFFPEKRDFFLEGQGIFAFGGSQGGRFGGPSNAPILFFSRRIGLQEEQALPITAGGRLTGKVGKYSVGILDIGTSESEAYGLPSTNFAVLRVKRDVLRRSNVGVIATRRTPAVDAPGSNQVLGVDASFNFFQNWSVLGYYAKTDTPGVVGRDQSYRARVDYAGDRYGFEAEYLTVGDNFNPEVGFVRRDDLSRAYSQLRFSPRPRESKRIRKYNFETSLDYIENGAGRLESREAQISMRIDFQNGDDFNVEYSRKFEYLDAGFNIYQDITIPLGEYPFQDVRASYRLGPQHKVSGWFNVSTGSFYSGTRTETGYFGRVELSPQLAIEPRYSLNWVDLPEGSFKTNLVSARVNYSVNPRVSMAALVQYNSAANLLTSSLRFRWEFSPGSDFFLVYNDGRDTLSAGYPGLLNRSLIVKVTRLFRF